MTETNKKKKVVWILGKTNSGKSFIATELSKIFITERFADLKSQYVGVKAQCEYNTQLVNIDEVNFFTLFKPDNMSRIKTLFEGKGWYLERKNEHPEEAYIDAFCFVSSNGLPTIATKFEIGSEKYNDYWAPILSRM